MLFIYGALMPVRVMELVRHWKMQESEHTAVILQAAPMMEREYVQMLQSWEPIFSNTVYYTNQWLDSWLTLPVRMPPHAEQTVDALIDTALKQSRLYVEQLTRLSDHCNATASLPLLRTMIRHSILESNYYIGLASAYRESAHCSEDQEPRPSSGSIPY